MTLDPEVDLLVEDEAGDRLPAPVLDLESHVSVVGGHLDELGRLRVEVLGPVPDVGDRLGGQDDGPVGRGGGRGSGLKGPPIVPVPLGGVQGLVVVIVVRVILLPCRLWRSLSGRSGPGIMMASIRPGI